MKYCTNCGEQIKGDNKFCTNCGTPVKDDDKPYKENETDFKTDSNSSISYSRYLIIAGFIGVIALFFVIKSLTTNNDTTGNSFSVSRKLSKVEGKWYDPTGVLLGDKHAIINIVNKGERAIGKDDNNIIKFELIPKKNNHYFAKVIFHGVKGDFDVKYNSQKEKLVFVNQLTKASWNIIKF